MSRKQEIEAGARWIDQRLRDTRGYIADVRGLAMQQTKTVDVSVWRIVELVAAMAEKEFEALQALPAHTREADQVADHLLLAVQRLERAFVWFTSEREAYHGLPVVLEAAQLIGVASAQLCVGAELTRRRTKPRVKRENTQIERLRQADAARPRSSSQALANAIGKPDAARQARRMRAKAVKP